MRYKFTILFLIATLFCDAQNVQFSDSIFKLRLVNSTVQNQRAKDLSGNYFAIDANDDGEIQLEEAEQVSYINLGETSNGGIFSLVGINEFPNLNYFYCSDVSLYGLDIHGLQHLESLIILSSGINEIVLYDLPVLKLLNLKYNDLSILDLSNVTSIENLICSNNDLTNLDLSMLTNLNTISCGGNQIETLNMKNGRSQTILNYSLSQGFTEDQKLKFICVDESELEYMQNLLITMDEDGFFYNSEQVVINDYCTFTPGGEYFTINGHSKIDLDNNGCESSTIYYPNLKFVITDDENFGSFYSDENGNYSFPVQAGNHSITPTLEDNSYFNVYPTNFSVNFPTDGSSINQSICLTPNGIYNDLEILIFPIDIAQPGFDADYKIVFKNKGTTIQSGSINLSFFDDTLDYISSDTSISSQSINQLTWDFTDLVPFESREINLVFNLNTPFENPPLNNDDILSFTVTIDGETDESPADNEATIRQIVVNSFDPNDKACLEGKIITPDMVGEYVHYLIRFENNGTANARNVVVKDMIDIDKFNIDTLVPIQTSHLCETRISNTNKVEFIFQNIQLPFDDATNDGYILFKIKTKSTLGVGDTFSNFANIYFDYNFPIITNDYDTTIQNPLGLVDNNFIDYITIYPNPVIDLLQFKTDKKINKIEIYDVAGRIVSSNSITENNIDLGDLKSGSYILKVFTDNEILKTKIIKN